jgi:hypothetical protein
MKPVYQTKFSLFFADGKRLTYGNCLIACIASILDQPIDEVPNVYTFYGLDDKLDNKNNKVIENHLWFNVMDMWLELKHKKQLIKHELNEPTEQEYVIMRGLSKRGNAHSCIYINNGNGWLLPYFDPHPTSQFLNEEQYYYTIE